MSVIIGLHQVKYLENLAQVRRVVSAYGGDGIYMSGPRIQQAMNNCDRLPRELRMRQYSDVACVPCDGLPIEACANMGNIPVAVEIVDGAQSLPWFDHPEKAMYVFGPEDGSIPSALLRRCHAVVSIPTAHCLNLSHAVATILYDRMMKNETKSI